MSTMPYLIDGHNLIPKIGLRLDDDDDEQQLIVLLQEFCRLRHKEVSVYFDNAPPGGMPVRKYGAVTAYFIRSGHTADQAIQNRLNRLGAAAKNWIVVSSDRAVQLSARAARAPFIPSEAFAHDVKAAVDVGEPAKSQDVTLSKDEVDDWLRLFGKR